MTKPDYRAPVEPAPKIPLAVQAAKYAFWAPLVSIILSLLLSNFLNSTNNASTRQAFGWFYLALNGSAIVAAVVALLGMRKHGKSGILVRSCIAILLGGFLLGSALYTAYAFKPADLIARRLVGEWESSLRTTSTLHTKTHLSLNADRSASVQIMVDDKTLTMHGKWGIHWATGDPTRLLVKWDEGSDPKMGDGAIWTIEHIEQDQMTLLGAKGDAAARETFQRK